MKQYTFPLILLVVGFSCIGYGIATNKPPVKQPVSIEYFKKGQILLPDYACTDTLIVVNAEGLNKGMALIEQGIIDATDYEIDSVLHSENKNGLLTCMTFDEYINFLDGEGYRQDIALHLALVDFNRIPADDLYQAIKED